MTVELIRILSDAESDLHEGRAFYASQVEKIGDYFFDSLLSDIESLVINAGIHKKQFGFFRMPGFFACGWRGPRRLVRPV